MVVVREVASFRPGVRVCVWRERGFLSFCSVGGGLRVWSSLKCRSLLANDIVFGFFGGTEFGKGMADWRREFKLGRMKESVEAAGDQSQR